MRPPQADMDILLADVRPMRPKADMNIVFAILASDAAEGRYSMFVRATCFSYIDFPDIDGLIDRGGK
jgi:hypothetical protein